MYMDYGTNPVQFLCNFAHLLPIKLTRLFSLARGALWRVASPVFLRPIPISLITCGLFWAVTLSPVYAQACGVRTDILNYLKKKYEESPTAIGVADNGNLVELIRTEEGKTWTLIVTLPSGEACLLASGENWEAIPKAQFGDKT